MQSLYTDYLSLAGFTPISLKKAASQASQFHSQFLAESRNSATGLRIVQMPDWGEKFIRRSGGIPQALLEKLGSNSFSKRRPGTPAPFLNYIQKRYDERALLHFRIVVGPVKNAQLCGAHQEPDLAEYLMFLQLAKLMEAIAPLYPYGIKVQMVPDDMRGRNANCWPAAYSKRYISGLRQMAKDLQFSHWLDVEEGQARLYALYNVEKHLDAAREEVLRNPDYQSNLATACIKAGQNFVAGNTAQCMESDICDSAMRYLVCHKAEILSGMWSPEDAFPLIYANHPGNYQLYTMGTGITKLPWQIRLPFSAMEQEKSEKYVLSVQRNSERNGLLNA